MDQSPRQLDTVHLSFRYTEEEYLAAIRFYFWHSKELLARLLVSCLLFSIGLLLIYAWLEFLIPVWANVILMLIAGVAFFHGYVIDLPRGYFRGDPKFREEYNLTFSEEGIEFRTQNINSRIAWNLYTRVVENDSFYILVYGKNIHSLSIIPKRVFQNSQQERTFREMLRRHIDSNLKVSDGELEKKEYVPARLEPPDWR
jgi:YcxB-like protein